MLLPIDNVLDAKEVSVFRTQLSATAPWIDGKTTAGGQAANVKNNVQLDDSSELAEHLRQRVLQKLSNHPLFIAATLPAKIYPPKFNCYQGGGHYGLHVDNAIMSLPNQHTLRTDISATLFLSDPDDYEGGELTIETQYGAQAIKLNAGDMIIYPSNSLHEVKAVTRGKRLCCFFWIQSLVRNPFQREQLFELDQTIQVLTLERGPTDREVRKLTGLYHNLVRHWAETV